MDPYLEEFWEDVHTSMMVYLRNALQSQLPDGLRARVEERVTVDMEEDEGKALQFLPDAVISESNPWATGTSKDSAPVNVAEPIIITADPKTERHLEIVDFRRGHRVVTVLEVLSPTNKLGDRGREAYRRKQDAYLRTPVNLVEIDLIREGGYALAAPLDDIPKSKLDAYMVCVFRATPPSWEVYPISMRTPLPAFRIPLRPSDRDVVVDLQPILDQAYADGGYDGDIHYDADPEPVKDAMELAWIGQLLREKGYRET